MLPQKLGDESENKKKSIETRIPSEIFFLFFLRLRPTKRSNKVERLDSGLSLIISVRPAYNVSFTFVDALTKKDCFL